MDYKEKNLETYERYADSFNEKFDRHFKLYVQDKAERFIRGLPGRRVLDVGCGPGNHSQYFKSQGLNVLGIDISPRMVELTRAKGVPAEVQDIENLDLKDQIFDGIWMYASLLHVPRSKAGDVIDALAHKIRLGGLFAIAVKEGIGEGIETHTGYLGTESFFSYYREGEIEEFFKQFEKIEFARSEVQGKYTFLHYLFKKV